MSEKGKGNAIIAKLFDGRLISDVEIFENPIKRTYTQDGKINWNGGDYRVSGITTDDKLSDVIDVVVKQEANNTYPATDILFTSLATGSVDYIKWVKECTKPMESNDRAAFEDDASNDPGPNTGTTTSGASGAASTTPPNTTSI